MTKMAIKLLDDAGFLVSYSDRDPLLNIEWNLSGDCGRP